MNDETFLNAPIVTVEELVRVLANYEAWQVGPDAGFLDMQVYTERAKNYVLEIVLGRMAGHES